MTSIRTYTAAGSYEANQHPHGNWILGKIMLHIADAYKGLMRVGSGGGKATVLANEADGVPLRFTNGVDVDQVTGEVFFTDSSMNYQRSQHESHGYWRLDGPPYEV